VGYVRAQEWYRDRAILETLVERLRQAGLPDGDEQSSGCAVVTRGVGA